MSARQLLNWVPDSFLALCAAATAGALTIFVRLTLALRDLVRGRGGTGARARPLNDSQAPTGSPSTGGHRKE